MKAAKDGEEFKVGKNLEGKNVEIDWSKVQDLYDEDMILEEIEEADDLVIDLGKKKPEGGEKKKQLSKKVLDQV